jgi:hypothetical protein
VSTGRERVRLGLLLRELGEAAGEIDPFAGDWMGGPLFAYIATLASKAAELARDLEAATRARPEENTGEVL